MDISGKLKAAIASADETYLTGLSNKGTLNRAKKDLEGLKDITASSSGDDIAVQWDGIQCVIRAPLGSSSCSCPSSSFCRHRITAILWLKSQLDDNANETRRSDFSSLRDFPSEKLIKLLGPGRISGILFRRESGLLPEITESSVVQVELPWTGTAVRLLDPLEHSTCSCHSSGLCVHKAEALIWWKLQKGSLSPDQLMTEPTSKSLDPEQVQGICSSIRETLAALMAWGLGRTDPEVCQTLERMASLCHTAGLPDLERSLRRLWASYQSCFARSAGFRDTDLLSLMGHTFRLAQALEQARGAELAALAGAFREEYRQVGNRKLYLLGSRSYEGKNGYNGTIYYFWDQEDGGFWSFRYILPTYYDGKARKLPKHTAPWGLPCTLDKLWNYTLELSAAKANRNGTLSATEECAAAIIGHRKPWEVISAVNLCRDFRELLERSHPGNTETARLVLVRPSNMELHPYDRIRQIYSLRLLDEAGRDLWVTVPFSQEEAPVIDALERLTKQESGSVPVFFGILGREGDRLTLYPIEYFTGWEDMS